LTAVGDDILGALQSSASTRRSHRRNKLGAYYYEAADRVALLGRGATGVIETHLFDRINHPLRITRGPATVYV
jgi:hypothetical protein